MDLRVAVGAAIIEKRRIAPPHHMPRMALKAEKRHGRIEEMVVDRTVG